MESIIDATYVINMDTDVTRLEGFGNMMSASNWNYTRHSAIDGKALMGSWNDVKGEKYEILRKQLEMKKKYLRTLPWITGSEIGCALSHIALWEIVANDPDKQRIAIFEDDARSHISGTTINDLITGLYTYLEENDIPEPDMLYLGKALDDCMSYERVWNNVYKSRHPLCLHAYIITKQGAQKLLNMAPFTRAIDIIPIDAIKSKIINVMAFHPSIYFQDVFNNISNLRATKFAINHTTECMVAQQHISGDTWEYTIFLVIGIIAAIILFILFSP